MSPQLPRSDVASRESSQGPDLPSRVLLVNVWPMQESLELIFMRLPFKLSNLHSKAREGQGSQLRNEADGESQMYPELELTVLKELACDAKVEKVLLNKVALNHHLRVSLNQASFVHIFIFVFSFL